MLSLSMIVRDEARNLADCLASVAGFVDEMVVVDTGSGDETIAVAERCGAVVHRLPWPGDFAPARNRALELVGGDWVLVLDADERLRPEAKQPLRQLMDRPEVLLITLLRQELGAVQSPYSSVSRLFRRLPQIRWSGSYHAMVDESVAALIEREPHWRLAHCTEPALLHHGYRPELLAGGGKAQRLRRAMEAELRSRPDDPYACAKLGGLELAEGHPERAIALLERGLAGCPADAHPERQELLLHLAMARAQQDPAAAAALYRQVLDLPLDPRLTLAARINLSALLQRHGELEPAARLAAEATAAAPEVALGWYNLGLIERHRGDLGAATRAYRRAIELDPTHAAARQNLAVAQLLAGEIEAARQGFATAIALLQQQGKGAEAADLARRAGAMVKLES